MSDTATIFNRRHLRLHRERASATLAQSDFLYRALAERMADRLLDVRQRFPLALDLGAHNGLLAPYVQQTGKIDMLVQADISQTMLVGARGLKVIADEELLPFAPASFDLVMSVNSLHWVNDLPGALIQINRALKPGGLLLAMVPGGETLKELRQAFEQAEMRLRGGVCAHISPFLDVKDGGSLLQRAGFTLPVADTETITVAYEDPMRLLYDLRYSGETNTLHAGAKTGMRRSLLLAAMEEYRTHFQSVDGRYAASFELVTLAGWKA